MARTYLSILTEDFLLENKVNFTIQSTNYAVGYSGCDEGEFIEYLKSNNVSNHILFVKPTRNYQSAYLENNLKGFVKIDIIIIAPELSDEQIGIIQASGISGYIIEPDINTNVFKDIINQLYWHNYYANPQIPKIFWENNPKTNPILRKPKFTKREEKIVQLLCNGFTGVDVSIIIGTSISNVHNHIERIKSKIYAHSNMEIVAICISNSWVSISREKFKRHNPFITLNKLKF